MRHESSFSCPSIIFVVNMVSCGERFISHYHPWVLFRGRRFNSRPSCLGLLTTSLSLLIVIASSHGGSSRSPFKLSVVESVSTEGKKDAVEMKRLLCQP